MRSIPNQGAQSARSGLLLGAIAVLTLGVAPAAAEAPKSCASSEVAAAFADFGRTGKLPPDVIHWFYDRQAQRVEPWQAFDHVYFVGICWVSAWLLTTPQGDILIDALYEPFTDVLLDNIRKVGADPKDIKYVLVTHGHFDHAAGASRLRARLPKARFVMTATAWSEGADAARTSQSDAHPWTMPAKDVVARDGDTFTVDDLAVQLHETPGHTLGTASYTFDVHDGAATEHAVVIGGLGLNAIKDAAQVEAYLASVAKLRALVSAPDRPIAVHLTTHPFSNGMFEAVAGLKTRKPGEPHPLVDHAAILGQLDRLETAAKERLQIERAKQPAPH